MLAALKYGASDRAKSSDSWKSQCADAIKVYTNLQGSSKHEFLKTWARNKRDLSWTKAFTSEEAELSEDESGEIRGYMTMHEILMANSLPTDMPSAQASLVLKCVYLG